jgi:hypothetical protein
MLQLGEQDQTLTNNEMGILPLLRAAAAAAPNLGELEAGWRHLLLLPSEDMDQETMESQFMCLKSRPEVQADCSDLALRLRPLSSAAATVSPGHSVRCRLCPPSS